MVPINVYDLHLRMYLHIRDRAKETKNCVACNRESKEHVVTFKDTARKRNIYLQNNRHPAIAVGETQKHNTRETFFSNLLFRDQSF